MSSAGIRKKGVALAFGAVLAACSDPAPPPASAAPEPVLVETQVIGPASAGVVEASGLVAFRRETPLSFAAAGRVEAVLAEEGASVRAGQILSRLKRTTSGADDREAETARRTAEQDVERTRRLFERGFASQAALDRALLALEKVREDVALAAPADGVILRRSLERGQVVSPGEAVFVLGESRAGMVVRAPVSAAEAARIRQGLAARVSVRGRAEADGRVLRTGAKSEEATGLFEVEILIEGASGLRSGEVAQVRLQPEAQAAAADGVLIPTLALVNARADQAEVFVLADGRARRRGVETGGVTSEGVLVLTGLAPGDVVITRGAARLKDGDQVRTDLE